jgi:PAS domain S-box-containing protein
MQICDLKLQEQLAEIAYNIIASLAIGIIITDLQGNLLYMNSTSHEMWGYDDSNELLGKQAAMLWQGNEKIYREIMDVLHKKEEWVGDLVAVKKDATTFHSRILASMVKGETGKPLCITAAIINTEIIDREQTEGRLYESNIRAQTLFATTPDVILELDNNLRITWANRAALEINPDAVGQTCYEAYCRSSEPCRGCQSLEAMDTGKKQMKVIFNPRHVLGPTYWENVAVPLYNKDNKGNSISVITTERNITDSVNQRKALIESQEFNANLLSCSPNPILVLNPDGYVRYVNPALEKLTGFSAKELYGLKYPFPWWTEDALYKKKIRRDTLRALRKGLTSSEELFKKKNGERFWVLITVVPVKSKGKIKYYLANWVDITQQKRLWDNLQLYAREVTRAQEEERRRLARELHDDTVQSLSCLYNDIDRISMKSKPISEELCHELQCLRVRIDNIVDEVRRFSHELRPGLLDRFGLMPSLELLVNEACNDGKVECHLEVFGKARRLVSETEIVLFRIAQEALRNIRKHSEAKEATLTVRFSKNRVKLTIDDNGIGFEVPQVIGNFARMGKLGMIGMDERARVLDGNLTIESESGKGSRISVEVPV